jgi:hypothetical protein
MPHEVSPDAVRKQTVGALPRLNPTTPARVAMGTLLALGCYLGVRKIVTGTVLAVVSDPNEWWLSFNGLIAVYTSQAVAVVFGSILASAGRPRGFAHGLAVGVICGALFLAFELLAGVPPQELVLYLQPPVLALVGLIAGVVGARIWSVTPLLDIPLPNPSKLSSIHLATDATTNSGRPTVWMRVVIGTAIMICGAMVADLARHFVQKNSVGLLQVQTQGQGEFITWQLATFAILIGGLTAGAGTGAGLRHGLIAGAIAGLALLAVCLKEGAAIAPIAYGLGRLSLEELPVASASVFLVVMGSVLLVSLVGGWLGGALFLPLAPPGMRNRIRIGANN